MILTNTYQMIIEEKARRDMTWHDLAVILKYKYDQNVMDAAKRGNLSDSFVKLAEALGCDIVISLKPRPSDPKEFSWKISAGRKYRRKDEK